jgi:hypothetical protein
MAWPSIAVSTDEAVPGTLTMIAGIDPPTAQEQYSPPISARAWVGDREKDTGMKMAKAMLSLRPGIEPTISPATMPISRKPSTVGCINVAKPRAISSMGVSFVSRVRSRAGRG